MFFEYKVSKLFPVNLKDNITSSPSIFKAMALQSNNSTGPVYLIEVSPPINKSIEQEFNLVLDFSLSRA